MSKAAAPCLDRTHLDSVGRPRAARPALEPSAHPLTSPSHLTRSPHPLTSSRSPPPAHLLPLTSSLSPPPSHVPPPTRSNPIENEAVVAELLRRSGGAIELEDGRAEADALIGASAPGMASWRVIDGNLFIHPNFESARRSCGPSIGERRRFAASMWPPTEGEAALPLDRCIRCGGPRARCQSAGAHARCIGGARACCFGRRAVRATRSDASKASVASEASVGDCRC